MKILAVFMFMLPGMAEPIRQEKPVATLEECTTELGKMLAMIAIHHDEKFQAITACMVSSEKTDPA